MTLSVRRSVAALAVGAALVLAGCGGPAGPDRAAVVDGRVITETAVQSAGRPSSDPWNVTRRSSPVVRKIPRTFAASSGTQVGTTFSSLPSLPVSNAKVLSHPCPTGGRSSRR